MLQAQEGITVTRDGPDLGLERRCPKLDTVTVINLLTLAVECFSLGVALGLALADH